MNIGLRGDAATLFERDLIAQYDTRQPRTATDVWTALAQRIGADALVAVLDEFGGEKISIPSRREFFATLYRPYRNAEIVRLHATGFSLAELGRQYGVNKSTILKALRCASGKTCNVARR